MRSCLLTALGMVFLMREMLMETGIIIKMVKLTGHTLA